MYLINQSPPELILNKFNMSAFAICADLFYFYFFFEGGGVIGPIIYLYIKYMLNGRANNIKYH